VRGPHTHTHSLLSYTHTHSVSLPHAHIHTHTHFLSHTHTHTLSLALSLSFSLIHTHTLCRADAPEAAILRRVPLRLGIVALFEQPPPVGSIRRSSRNPNRCSFGTLFVAYGFVHRVSSSLLGPVDPSFQALSGRLKFTVRRHKFNEDYLYVQ